MKKNLLKLFPVIAFAVSFPIITFAQFVGPCQQGTYNNGTACVPISGLMGFISTLQQILNSIIPLLILLGVVYFIWGVINYVIENEEEAKKKGRDRMIFGIIGLAVIIGLWGLVNMVTATFGLTGSSIAAPQLVTTTTAAGSGSACTLPSPAAFQDYLGFGTCLINNSIIPFIFAVAIVMFIWGAVNFFIINADEEAKRAQGKQYMIWGIVALAVMLSVWGLVGIIQTTFGLKTGGTAPSFLPQVHPSS